MIVNISCLEAMTMKIIDFFFVLFGTHCIWLTVSCCKKARTVSKKLFELMTWK